jgi:nucleotide-binding universal stress UspA family protein
VSVNQAVAVSQLLQKNWSLSSPLAVANILWPTTRIDAIGVTQGKGTVQIAVYNASPSKQVDALSRECYLVTEKLVVDVIVVNASQSNQDLAAAEATLESLQAEVYRVIHLQDPNFVVSGEPIHSNAPEITRLMVNVDAVSFQISA